MRIATCAAVLYGAALVCAQETPLIRVPVRLVPVPTLVFSEEGAPLPGLEKPDFRLLDNERLQQFTFDATYTPVSVVMAVQVSRDVRGYLPFIAKVGSCVDTLLAGATGDSAVIAYDDDIKILKPFGPGDVQSSLRKIAMGGPKARAIDAGLRAIDLLKSRRAGRTRILMWVGQPIDSGSEGDLQELRDQAERENVAVFALSLPIAGKAFVSDTFTLEGPSSSAERGGFKAGVDLLQLMAVVRRSSDAAVAKDPFSVLTSATGGSLFHFRRQTELENAIAAVGVQLRSSYLLSYYPDTMAPGFHAIRIEVTPPGAKAYARPGYWRK